MVHGIPKTRIFGDAIVSKHGTKTYTIEKSSNIDPKRLREEDRDVVLAALNAGGESATHFARALAVRWNRLIIRCSV